MGPGRILPFEHLIQVAIYPFLLAFMAAYAWLETSAPDSILGQYYAYYLAILAGILLTVEILYPLRREWRMTRASFFRRDLPFMVIGGVTIALAQYVSGLAIIQFGLERGTSHAGLPLLPGVILILLGSDFIWYWIHRWSHEGRGPVGRWLWKIHAAHHLPQQVYLFMHGVAHPLNTIIVRLIFTVPFFFLGFSTEAIFVSNLVIGLHGLVSHFNVDVRAGVLNYLFMGTELHRYHHSAAADGSRNYGSTLVLWDLLFGTFVYRPGMPPRRLGVADPDKYPNDRQILGVLAMPFVKYEEL
jgi:sterol desaturase/sphingolipid hydroxylase (fatty acid hydroxylase superfamily)